MRQKLLDQIIDRLAVAPAVENYEKWLFEARQANECQKSAEAMLVQQRDAEKSRADRLAEALAPISKRLVRWYNSGIQAGRKGKDADFWALVEAARAALEAKP